MRRLKTAAQARAEGVRTELGRAIRASFSSTQPNLWPQSVSRDLAAEMFFQTLARDPDPMLRAAVTGSLDPYIPGKHPTTHCFFCVTCDMLVPQERHEEHAGHEIER